MTGAGPSHLIAAALTGDYMILKVAAALAAWSSLAGTALAANVTAQDPQSVVTALHQAGYKAALTKDEAGDPMIESGANGSTFIIFFMNCTKNTDCRTIQFYAGYNDYKGNHQKMNEWNRDNRFGRGYISDKGMARIEMDVDLDDGGLSPLLFIDNLEFWVLVMSEFEKFISQSEPATSKT